MTLAELVAHRTCGPLFQRLRVLEAEGRIVFTVRVTDEGAIMLAVRLVGAANDSSGYLATSTGKRATWQDAEHSLRTLLAFAEHGRAV